MKLKTRFSILAFLIVTFVVIAPMIVFFALGYRWDGQTHRLVPTGTLLIASMPRDAEIFINDKPSGSTTPATLRLLVPGEYEISLHKDGYEIWHRRVTIFEKRVSVVRENNRPAALFLKNREPQLLATSTSAVIFSSQYEKNTGDEFVYSVEEGTLFRSDKNSNNKQALAYGLPAFKSHKIFENAQGRLFILLDSSLYSTSEGQITLTATNVENGKWNSTGEIFIYNSKNTLWLYDARRGTYELITRTTEDINDLSYDTGTHHIVYAAGNEIHSVEADFNTSRAAVRVIENETEIQRLELSQDGKTAYYLTQDELFSLGLR